MLKVFISNLVVVVQAKRRPVINYILKIQNGAKLFFS